MPRIMQLSLYSAIALLIIVLVDHQTIHKGQNVLKPTQLSNSQDKNQSFLEVNQEEGMIQKNN